VADLVIANYSGIDRNDLLELIESSSIKDLTEYGRVVHAEMEAMLSCARNGIGTVNGCEKRMAYRRISTSFTNAA